MADESKRTFQYLPPEIKEFSWGAFFIPVYWCLLNRVWGWFLVFLLLDAMWGWDIYDGRFIGDFYSQLIYIRLAAAIYLGFRGKRFAWKKCGQQNILVFVKVQRAIAVFGAAYAFFFYAFFYPMPGFFRARAKSNFTACTEQLKNIASGMEQQISEKGSLRGVKSEDDVCHHILSGYEMPKECIGKVKARVDEVCLKDSLNVKVLDEYRYEIRAKANDKSQCNICVTEIAVRPKSYDPKGECRKFTCIHKTE